MLSLSTKSRYGMAALIELALNFGQGLVQIKEIVERRGVPKTYLEQIFNRLGKRGLIRSVRGNQGGYALAHDPAQISVLSVLEALEGEIELQSSERLPAMKELYATVESNMREVLGISLAEIAERQRALERRPMYHI